MSRASTLVVALVAGLIGCQGAKVSSGPAGGAGGTAGQAGSGGQSPASPTPPFLPPGSGASADAGPVSGTGGADGAGGACAEDVHAAEQTPVDILLLVDKSGSMIGPKWQMTSAALAGFAQDPTIRGAGPGGELLSRLRQRIEVHQRCGLRPVPARRRQRLLHGAAGVCRCGRGRSASAVLWRPRRPALRGRHHLCPRGRLRADQGRLPGDRTALPGQHASGSVHRLRPVLPLGLHPGRLLPAGRLRQAGRAHPGAASRGHRRAGRHRAQRTLGRHTHAAGGDRGPGPAAPAPAGQPVAPGRAGAGDRRPAHGLRPDERPRGSGADRDRPADGPEWHAVHHQLRHRRVRRRQGRDGRAPSWSTVSPRPAGQARRSCSAPPKT